MLDLGIKVVQVRIKFNKGIFKKSDAFQTIRVLALSVSL